MQRTLREAERAVDTAREEAAASVDSVKRHAAAEVREADIRARARIENELAEQRAQLAAQVTALKEERQVLQRHQATGDMLATLSARVEVVSAAAVAREEKLAHHLEATLVSRERRCVC
jgi:hypothetical protein